MGTVRNARVNQGGPKCAGIVGLGLIGGSFARGYAQAGVRVLAWDPDDDVMTAASMGTVAGVARGACPGTRRRHRHRGHHGPRGDRHGGRQGHRVRARL